jgi:TolB-like protein
MRRFFDGVPRVTALVVSLLMFRADLAGAQKVLPEGIKDLATQIATNAAKEQKNRIAVLPFRELDGRASVLGTFIAEELVTNLFMLGGMEIVERAMLDRVLGELKLAQTGVIDPETAKQVGKIAGVDAIVTGSITDLQSYVALNCRLIDAQTGRIFAAAQAKIVKDDDLRKIMGMQLVPAPTEAAKPPEPGRPAAPPSKATLQQQVLGILFELKECTLSGTTVGCAFLITSKTEDQGISLVVEGSRLVDESGNEYHTSGYNIRFQLTSGIPLKARMEFQKVSPEIRKGALVEVRFLTRSEDSRVQFRDVPLTRE